MTHMMPDVGQFWSVDGLGMWAGPGIVKARSGPVDAGYGPVSEGGCTYRSRPDLSESNPHDARCGPVKNTECGPDMA